MARFYFWQRWLLVLSIVIVLFGLAMALLNNTPLFDVINQNVDPAFWGDQALPGEALAFRGWAYGVMGSTMAGWGVFFIYLALFPFKNKERWAWSCMLVGVLAWYVPDTMISLAYAVTFNAAINTVLLVLLALPLIFTRREFGK